MSTFNSSLYEWQPKAVGQTPQNGASGGHENEEGTLENETIGLPYDLGNDPAAGKEPV